MRTFIVGPGGHYREGRLYREGDTIALEKDEKPHPEWVEVKAPAPEPAPKRGRKAKEEDSDEVKEPAKQRERLFDKDII